MSELIVAGLTAGVPGRIIVHDVGFTLGSGEVHVIMGPNGSGKSTISNVIAGRPGYEIVSGSATLDGVELLSMAPWERARAGLFLGQQHPIEVPGVDLGSVLEAALRSDGRSVAGVRDSIDREAAAVGFDVRLLDRGLNVDMSGGEKKRSETLQLAVLDRRFAILDELDSGLDVDGLRMVSRRIGAMVTEGLGVLVITHFTRLLDELPADRIHVLVAGRIVATGGPELGAELQATGYGRWSPDTDGTTVDSVDTVDPFADPVA